MKLLNNYSFSFVLFLLFLSLTTTNAQSTSTELISIAFDGTAGNNGSYHPSVSADGRYVAFVSYASNIVSDDTNNTGSCSPNCADIFVRDRQTGLTTRVSLTDGGQQTDRDSSAPVISADGKWVAFSSQASNLVPNSSFGGVILHSIESGLNFRMDVASDGTNANGHSDNPSISANGRFVTFESSATNLVPDHTTPTCSIASLPSTCFDIYVHDHMNGETALVSVSMAGGQANGDSMLSSLSADGRYVTFTSFASNLVPNDMNGRADVFVYDRDTQQMSRVSVSSSGAQGIATGGSGGPGGSGYATISRDGRYVVFISSAANLVPSDTNNHNDVFVHDRLTGQTTRESLSSAGAQPNGDSNYEEYLPHISDDGRYITFESLATNLVPGDTNGQEDVFVRDRLTHQTARISVTSAGVQGSGGNSYYPVMNPDGRFLAFVSLADDLVPGFDNSSEPDIYFIQNPIWAVPIAPDTAPNRNYFTSLPVTLTWSGISWAAQYEVTIATDPQFKVAPFLSDPLPASQLSYTFDAFPLTDGIYYWKVRAMNAAGIPGAWSAIERFLVDVP